MPAPTGSTHVETAWTSVFAVLVFLLAQHNVLLKVSDNVLQLTQLFGDSFVTIACSLVFVS